MTFRWLANNTLNARLKDLLFFRISGPVLLRNPIFLSFYREGGGPDPMPPPPLDPHMNHLSYPAGTESLPIFFESEVFTTHVLIDISRTVKAAT